MRQQFGRERARGEEDYYRILNRLPAETRDYVPLMIAAARITKDPARTASSPCAWRRRQWDEVTVPPATPLDRIADAHRQHGGGTAGAEPALPAEPHAQQP
jgi:hypothetical protein